MGKDKEMPKAAFHSRFSEVLGGRMCLWVNGGLRRKSLAVRVRKVTYGRKHGVKILLGH